MFADSSALVKLYVQENGSEHVAGLTSLAVSALARVEVPAALWRKVRGGALPSPAARHLLRAFAVHLSGGAGRGPRFGVLIADDRTLDHAGRLTAAHDLHGFDAVQLASALAARSIDSSVRSFACFDRDLREAAAANGFELVPDTL